MENYCTACGKWLCLVAFWRCRACLNRFYDALEGAAVNGEFK